MSSICELSDRDLLVQVQRATDHEREATAQLVALLMEVEARRLYLAEGCSSLFTYCTQVLHLTEHAAYGRIEAARAARRFPVVLERLAEGTVSLTAVGLLSPHLTDTNHQVVLDGARHKSKREVEHMVAALRPRPDVPSTVRQLPPARGESNDQSPHDRVDASQGPHVIASPQVEDAARRPAEVRPLAPQRYKVQFTMSQEGYADLRRAQDLLRHSIPDGDPAAVFERALKLLVGELSRTKLAATPNVRPRPARASARRSRHIPAAVKRAVWQRDEGRCAFRGTHGRCSETGFLEFHHVVPFGAGGDAVASNIELRCRAHNAHEAELYYGVLKPETRPTPVAMSG